MPWTLTRDLDEFAREALSILAEDPIGNTLVLSITDMLRTGHGYSDQPPLFGWYDDPAGFGGLVMTPPYEMILVGVGPEATPDLVGMLREAGVEVPGVNAAADTAQLFAEEWTHGRSLGFLIERRQRLYRLDGLREPAVAAKGAARPARPDEVTTILTWMSAFVEEVHLLDAVSDSAITGRIADGRLWLWEDPAGTPVAFAGRQKTLRGVARVGPVYTPPEQRRHGYGTAVTAACTADALTRGATEVALFTDLANPTSNSIYQQIGFRPVSDTHVIRFHDR